MRFRGGGGGSGGGIGSSSSLFADDDDMRQTSWNVIIALEILLVVGILLLDAWRTPALDLVEVARKEKDLIHSHFTLNSHSKQSKLCAKAEAEHDQARRCIRVVIAANGPYLAPLLASMHSIQHTSSRGVQFRFAKKLLLISSHLFVVTNLQLLWCRISLTIAMIMNLFSTECFLIASSISILIPAGESSLFYRALWDVVGETGNLVDIVEFNDARVKVTLIIVESILFYLLYHVIAIIKWLLIVHISKPLIHVWEGTHMEVYTNTFNYARYLS